MSNVIPLHPWHVECKPRHIALWHRMGVDAFFGGLSRSQCPWDGLMYWPCARVARAHWLIGFQEAEELCYPKRRMQQ